MKTTDREAIGLPTLVAFGPVLASVVTPGKYLVTALTGTTAPRGSNGAVASPHAANANSAIAATESITAHGPRCRSNFASQA